MPDDTAAIELPRYARSIGLAGGSNGESAAPLGVLSSFGGLLTPTPADIQRPTPALSYLCLQPLVIESIRHEQHETVQSPPAEPKEDDTDTPERELSVSQLLERKRRHETERVVATAPAPPSGRTRDAPSMAVLRSHRPGNPDPQRPQTETDVDAPERAGPEPVRDVTVIDRATTAVHPIETVIGSRPEMTSLTGIERPGPTSERAPNVPVAGGSIPMVQASRAVAAGTGFDGAAPVTPAPVPDAGPSPAPTAPPMAVESSPGSPPAPTPTHPGGTGDGETDQQASRAPPALTVVDATPSPERADAVDRATETPPGPESLGTPFPPPGSDRATVQPDRTATRPTPDPTVTAITADRTEMNRLVDRLYEEVQRKQRVERERRGL